LTLCPPTDSRAVCVPVGLRRLAIIVHQAEPSMSRVGPCGKVRGSLNASRRGQFVRRSSFHRSESRQGGNQNDRGPSSIGVRRAAPVRPRWMHQLSPAGPHDRLIVSNNGHAESPPVDCCELVLL
jgi:hypothetical protein